MIFLYGELWFTIFIVPGLSYGYSTLIVKEMEVLGDLGFMMKIRLISILRRGCAGKRQNDADQQEIIVGIGRQLLDHSLITGFTFRVIGFKYHNLKRITRISQT